MLRFDFATQELECSSLRTGPTGLDVAESATSEAVGEMLDVDSSTAQVCQLLSQNRPRERLVRRAPDLCVPSLTHARRDNAAPGAGERMESRASLYGATIAPGFGGRARLCV